MDTKYNYSLFESCEAILYEVTLQIFNNYDNQEAMNELYNFLNNNETIYESVFTDFIAYDFDEDKTLYKNIMKLIIVSNCYQYTICQLEKGIAKEEELENLYFLEKENPSSKELLTIFQDPLHQTTAYSFIEDFYDFLNMTYIYQLDSMNIILKTGRMSKLLQFNPFAILQYINMIEEDKFISSERAIQNFLDIYQKCYVQLIREQIQDEEDFENQEKEENDSDADYFSSDFMEKFMVLFLEELRIFYDNDNVLDDDISYIIANVYENAKVYEKEEPNAKRWVEFFEQTEYSTVELVELFKYDFNFFEKIMRFFKDFNDRLGEYDLEYNRERFKEAEGNIKILKQLNPFYEEEEYIYNIEKTVN